MAGYPNSELPVNDERSAANHALLDDVGSAVERATYSVDEHARNLGFTQP
jgi:hypothetical protein